MADIVPISAAVAGEPKQPRLLDRVRIALRTKHYSLRTEEAYIGWIRRFILSNGKRHPMEMGEVEINRFLSNLAVHAHVTASTQNQALCALLFLYRRVLEEPFPDLEKLVRARRPSHLPVVLTRAEVRAVLRVLSGTPHIVATLLYGSGLRAMKAIRLRVKDLEFGLNHLVVRDGKGQKDRRVPFPFSVRPALVTWLARVRRWYDEDRAAGRSGVYLPAALERKYPGANLEWGWRGPFLLRTFRQTLAPGWSDGTIFTSVSSSGLFDRPCATPPSVSPRAATPSGTPSRLICSRTATTFERFKSCSGTAVSRRR